MDRAKRNADSVRWRALEGLLKTTTSSNPKSVWVPGRRIRASSSRLLTEVLTDVRSTLP